MSITLLKKGIKLYNSEKFEESIQLFMDSANIDGNCLSLEYLCKLSKMFSEIPIMDILKRKLKYTNIRNRLTLLEMVRNRFPKESHELYKGIYSEHNLIAPARIYILKLLLSKPLDECTNSDLSDRLSYCIDYIRIRPVEEIVCEFMNIRKSILARKRDTPLDLDAYFNVRTQTSRPIHIEKTKHNVGIIIDSDNIGMRYPLYYDIINTLDELQFNVFVYYNDIQEDPPNDTHRSVTWINIYYSQMGTIRRRIHSDNIDVLVDCIQFRSSKIIRLMATRCAKIQLGYPSVPAMKCYDNELHTLYWNPLVKIGSNDFINTYNNNKTIVGIVCNIRDITIPCITTWNAISRTRNVLFVSTTKFKIPNLKNVIYVTPKTTPLLSFLELFRSFDYVVDSFPNSDPFLVACSLYMGCPVIRIKGSVSTVSDEDYEFKTKAGIIKFSYKPFRERQWRKNIRKKLLSKLKNNNWNEEILNVLKKST